MNANLRLSAGTWFGLAALALSLAAPASAGREWYKNMGTNNWTVYNYHNLDFQAAGVFMYDYFDFGQGAGYQYDLLYYLNNYTNETHCYELEAKPPENYPNDQNLSLNFWFWENAKGKWSDLGGWAGSGYPKVRVFLKNGDFQVFIASARTGVRNHYGLYTTRLNLDEAACTTGQTALNWLKIKDDVQTVSIQIR
ncbi:MAG TPA: hypothetical protein VJ385_19775 [Fibrobacteria bacterium]|nr:hypothetical protein [Fibrobacteria bacterium]